MKNLSTLAITSIVALTAGVSAAQADKLTLYCSAQEDWCQLMARSFEDATGVDVNMTRKSSGETFAQIKAESANPKGDVWWGGTGDPHLQAAEEGLTLWTAMFKENSAVLATMPLFHIAACNLCLAGLYAGGRAVVVRDSNPEDTLRLIADQAITVVPLPATVIHQMTTLDLVDQVDLSALDTMLIAGSGIPVATLKAAQSKLKCGFALSYGMTECCGGLSYLGPQDCTFDAGKKLESAGRPFGDNMLKIVGPDGESLPPTMTGEILCQSRRVMKGYWNRPVATAEAKIDGWYHSGDAGYLDEDGYLYVVDRLKDMVISGGENIYPVEIENEIIQHPAIHDVAVIGIPDETWGEALFALLIGDGDPADDEDLIEFLRPRLAGYKIPRKFVWVDAFPRNATGKVLKRELRKVWADKI